jgi:dsDNA-specific endonuclease/ATPase MutS2
LPEEVIDSAARQPGERDDDSAELVEQLQAVRKAAAEDRQQAEKSRIAGERLEAEWRRKVEELDEREKSLSQSQTRTDPRAQLHHVRQEIDRLRRGESSRKSLLQSLRTLSAWLAQQLQIGADPKESDAANPPLRPGDEVYVRSLGKVGILNEVGARKAQVQLGTLAMTVATDDIDAVPEAG